MEPKKSTGRLWPPALILTLMGAFGIAVYLFSALS